MRVDTRLDEGEMLRVFGPATVRVLEGVVSILGAELKSGDSFPIDEFRSYVVKAETKAQLSVELGAGARLESTAPEEEPYNEWVSVADEIVESCVENRCIVTAVGPVDSGKTSMVAVVANRALRVGLRPGIVDCDIGQADLGPPGFVGLAYPSSWVSWLRRLDPRFLRFVGSIEPSGNSERLVLACRELAEKASSEAEIVVVDTDGWVEGLHALEHKISLLRALRATHVIVVGDKLLADMLRNTLRTAVYSLPEPPIVYSRSTSARRMLRQSNYKRFLGDAHLEVIDLRRVAVSSPCLSMLASALESSESIIDDDVIAVEYSGGLCIYTRKALKPTEISKIQKKYGKRETNVIDLNNVKYTLIALRKPDGSDCPALLLDIDAKRAEARVLTKCTPPFLELHIGKVKLNENLVEAARGRIIV